MDSARRVAASAAHISASSGHRHTRSPWCPSAALKTRRRSPLRSCSAIVICARRCFGRSKLGVRDLHHAHSPRSPSGPRRCHSSSHNPSHCSFVQRRVLARKHAWASSVPKAFPEPMPAFLRAAGPSRLLNACSLALPLLAGTCLVAARLHSLSLRAQLLAEPLALALLPAWPSSAAVAASICHSPSTAPAAPSAPAASSACSSIAAVLLGHASCCAIGALAADLHLAISHLSISRLCKASSSAAQRTSIGNRKTKQLFQIHQKLIAPPPPVVPPARNSNLSRPRCEFQYCKATLVAGVFPRLPACLARALCSHPRSEPQCRHGFGLRIPSTPRPAPACSR
jgi:hypothetical protein